MPSNLFNSSYLASGTFSRPAPDLTRRQDARRREDGPGPSGCQARGLHDLDRFAFLLGGNARRFVGAGDENRTRTISLGMSAGCAVTSIVAGRRHLLLSVSVRQMPWPSGTSGTQRAR